MGPPEFGWDVAEKDLLLAGEDSGWRGPHGQQVLGLLQSPGRLSKLPAVDHLQSSPRSLAELGIQGATEVVHLDIRQGVKANDDPIPRGQLALCMRAKVPPSPPEVRASLQFQVPVRLGIVRPLAPRDSSFGPQLGLWPLPGLLDSSVLPASRLLVRHRHMVPAVGLLSHLQVTAMVPPVALLSVLLAVRDDPQFQLVDHSLGLCGRSSRPAGQVQVCCKAQVSAHLLGLHASVSCLCSWLCHEPIGFLQNAGASGCHLFPRFFPVLGTTASNVLTLPGEFLCKALLWTPGFPGRVWHGHLLWALGKPLHRASCPGGGILLAISRLGLGCPRLCVRAVIRRASRFSACRPLTVLQGTLVKVLGWSGAAPGSFEDTVHRQGRQILHRLPGLAFGGLLASGHCHPGLWMHLHLPGLVLLILLPLLVDLLVLLLNHRQQLLLLVQQALLLHLLFFDHLKQDGVVQHLCPASLFQLAGRLVSARSLHVPLLSRLRRQPSPRSRLLRWEGRLPTMVAVLCGLPCIPGGVAWWRPPIGLFPFTHCQGILLLRQHCLGPRMQVPVSWPQVFLCRLDSWLTICFWNFLGIFRKIARFLQGLGLSRPLPNLSLLRLPFLSF